MKIPVIGTGYVGLVTGTCLAETGNEVANFSEKIGVDVDKVRIGMGTDSRIGKRFLFPGIGYGGSCFPKDVKALYKSGSDVGYQFDILNAVIELNNTQKKILIPRIESHFHNNINGKTFAIWGLAFKPETDDIREAPALYIIEELLNKGAKVQVFDPEAMTNVKQKFGDQIKCNLNKYDAAKGADALIICTEWSIFRNLDFKRLKGLMNFPTIFDGRNLFEVEDMENEGIYYNLIGRKSTKLI